jgi:hypothetical protein
MPRRAVTYKVHRVRGKGVPPGVRDDIAALALEGSLSVKEIALRYGVDPSTVHRIAENLSKIDPEHVAVIQRALPKLYAILSAEHGLKSLELVDDPTNAAKSMFASKMAAEAGRLSEPKADRPGTQILAFVQALTVTPAPHEGPVGAKEPVSLALAPAPEGWAGSGEGAGATVTAMWDTRGAPETSETAPGPPQTL